MKTCEDPGHMEQQIRFCKAADDARIVYSTVDQGPVVILVPFGTILRLG